eukprot:4899316-Amphidinium_carterae.1
MYATGLSNVSPKSRLLPPRQTCTHGTMERKQSVQVLQSRGLGAASVTRFSTSLSGGREGANTESTQ